MSDQSSLLQREKLLLVLKIELGAAGGGEALVTAIC